mmetsp:Transcript_8398/g.10601  ORF Transcript_8398/g.10601 Transcript_8398/m.10601 type:complete len:858 (+) Transcript_8398:97-2670(+)
MKVNNVSLAVIAVASKLSSSVANSTPLLLSVDGVTLSLDDAQVQYHKNQNHNGANEVAVSGNGLSAEMVGNLWRAFPLPEEGIEVDENTVLEFKFDLEEEADYQMICLDEDTKAKSARCFVLASRTGEPFNKKYYYPPQYATPENNSVDFKIPIGRFYTGNMKYFAFVQENDLDTSKGLSTISNIRMFSEEPNNLVMTQNGEEILIPDVQTYLYLNKAAGDKDSKQTFMHITDDGKSIQLGGNSWKALEFPSPIVISPKTVLEFDFNLIEATNGEAICFEEDRQITTDQKRCLFLHSTTTYNFDVLLGSENASEGVTKHYTIPIGLYYTGSFQYLAFISDNSVKAKGKSTFSNFQLYDDLTGFRLFSQQLSYGYNQDTTSSLVEVSPDGKNATLRGNLWKAFEIPGGLTIDDNSVLSFKFLMEEIAEITGICIEENLELEKDFPRCFPLAGDQDVSNDANWLYRGVEQTYSTNEWQTYVIRLSEFFHGDDFKYLVLVQDNDKTDRTTGTSSFKNIEFHETSQSCLKNVDFEFSFDECTIENFVNEVEQLMTNTPGCIGNNAWVELLAFFDVNSKLQIEEQIGAICTSGYKEQYLPFEVIMGKHFQFSDEFFDGGTTWNYENESRDDASRIKMVQENHANRAIGMPDVHNFKKCELRAAMCCYVASRKGTGVDAEPEDNSDACYMDFSGAQQSSHVRDGYSIYGNGVEGNLNCHGFAWGDDVGNADNALKGNSLFQVAMYDSLYEKGLAEELPGAPMCGCVEQMPVVTKANCTKVEVDQTVDVNYNGSLTEFSVNVEIRTINHVPCTDNDLSSHYQDLVEEGKASQMEKDYLDTRLVGEGNCPGAISTFLSEKGFSFS